jgi:hypothetical protein
MSTALQFGYGPASLARDLALERHFTAKELAELWSLDESTVRRLFQDQPDVLRIGKAGRRDGA